MFNDFILFLPARIKTIGIFSFSNLISVSVLCVLCSGQVMESAFNTVLTIDFTNSDPRIVCYMIHEYLKIILKEQDFMSR